MQIQNHMFFLLLLLPPCTVAQTAEDQSQANSGSTTTYSPFTILIAIISISVTITGAFAILVRHFSDRNSSQNAAGNRHRGLDTETINSLPTYLYSDLRLRRLSHEVEVDQQDSAGCAVCLCEFEDTEELRLLPGCCHVFHPDCIDPWLASHVTCPICRRRLIDPESGALRPHTTIDVPHIGGESNRPDRVDHHHDDNDGELKLSGDDHEKKHIVGKFLRSHSTGHSLVDSWAQNRLMNRPEVNGGEPTKPTVSPKNGHGQTGWFSVTPPPIISTQSGSIWSQRPGTGSVLNGSSNLSLSPV